MKRGTPKHRKMFALSEELKIPIAHAVGIMEMLWHYVGLYTPRGDIGSLPDEEIANAVSWPVKKASVLVGALVKTGWLDQHDECRLVVHDWEEHCENGVRKKLGRSGKDFIQGSIKEIRSSVYFVRSDNGNIKIGFTEGDVQCRVDALQSGNPERLTLIGYISGLRSEETRLHRKFSHLAIGGEWFRPGQDLLEYIKTVVLAADNGSHSRLTTAAVDGKQSHASREAMAKAMAKASESSEGVQGEAQSPPPLTPAIAVASGHGWEEFIGLFLAAGKHLNEHDVAQGLREWLSLELSDQLAAFRHLKAEAIGTEARFLPFPASFLRKRPWTRVGPDRVLPMQKRTRVDDAQDEALRIFKAQQEGGLF